MVRDSERLTREERVRLIVAAIRGLGSGAARSVVAWLIAVMDR